MHCVRISKWIDFGLTNIATFRKAITWGHLVVAPNALGLAKVKKGSGFVYGRRWC